MTTAASETALVRAAAAGDAAAISALYRRHFPDVERRCRRITGCPHEAADAAQDALLATFRRLPSLECETLRFGAYAAAAGVNAALERRRRRAGEVATGDESWLDSLGGVQESGHTALERRELREAVRAALRDVPERQRVALFRSVYEGHSCHAIAEELDLTANGVAQLLWRARRSLAEALQAQGAPVLC
ncbi:MAG: polymerase sigma-70 factor, subfamily [Solirubrobacteraceae bacterium]|jgi:RNA polymerase sigma-70 factor (ECF subfamily)|nr:polymerase sigma-70 factor, subfamily [Solirubrobacteraceae bacterium]